MINRRQLRAALVGPLGGMIAGALCAAILCALAGILW